jgi:hypothetical protein
MYVDGILHYPSASKFSASGKTVFIKSSFFAQGTIFELEYTPFYMTNQGVTAVNLKEDNSDYDKKEEYKYSEKSIVYASVVSDNIVEGAIGDKYLKLILPGIPEGNPVIERKYNGTVDLTSPVYIFEGINKNSFIKGRILYLPCDTTLFPKLMLSTYEVTIKIKPNVVTNHDYYYLRDGSILLGKAKDVSVRAIIKKESSESDPLVIKYPKIYYSTEG